jgi:hypothetical protein
MLHITIIHNTDDTHNIQDIVNITDDKPMPELLSEFDRATGKINLDVITPFLGQEVYVHHHYQDGKSEDYSINAELTDLEIDPITKLKSMVYIPIE